MKTVTKNRKLEIEKLNNVVKSRTINLRTPSLASSSGNNIPGTSEFTQTVNEESRTSATSISIDCSQIAKKVMIKDRNSNSSKNVLENIEILGCIQNDKKLYYFTRPVNYLRVNELSLISHKEAIKKHLRELQLFYITRQFKCIKTFSFKKFF